MLNILFYRPSIMGRQEDRLIGQPPSLNFQFDIDEEYQKNTGIIFELIDKAYDRIDLYIKRFDQIRLDYEMDLKTDPEVIRAETGNVIYIFFNIS